MFLIQTRRLPLSFVSSAHVDCGRLAAARLNSPKSAVPKQSQATSRPAAPQGISLLLFLLLFVTFAYFFHREAGWNVNSRLCLTYALVEKHSLMIDDYLKIDALKTEDVASFNGHFYSDKIIGTSLLGAIPMTALQLASRALGRAFSWDAKRYVVTVFGVSLLGALAGVMLFRLLFFFGASAGGALLLTLAFVFGTQMFGVSTIFLSYAPAICFETISYFLLVRNRDALDHRSLFPAGLALGAALLCEYTLGIVALGLSVYAIHHLPRKRAILWFWLGAAAPLLFFVGYTLSCFGRLTIPYQYEVRPEFQVGMSRGFLGIAGFNPTVLYYVTIHRYRGLFYHSPFLVLALWGGVAMWRDPRRRSDALLSISMMVGYLAFNASYYMWWGGWTNGPRHLIPALPFLIVPLVWVWQSGVGCQPASGAGGQPAKSGGADSPPRSSGHLQSSGPVVRNSINLGRGLLIALAVVSIFWNTLSAMVDAQIPQGYQAAELYHPRVEYNYRDPLWELGITAFGDGRLAANAGQLVGLSGLWSLVPLVVLWGLGGLATAWMVRRISDSGPPTEAATEQGRFSH